MTKKDKAKQTAAAAVNAIPSTTADPNAFVCTGNFNHDFKESWGRAFPDVNGMPHVRPRHRKIKHTEENKTINSHSAEADDPNNKPPTTYHVVPLIEFYKPSVQVEYGVEDTKTHKEYAKEIYIRGWKVQTKVVDILKQCMLEKLTTLNLWNVGMDEDSLTALGLSLKSIPNVKHLVLDGNPIPSTQPYHLLLTDNNALTHVSLRNNQITDIGATNISKILAMVTCPIISLNLSFNQIGDEGAKAIAKALRMNRTLLSLSLASNIIGDEGCSAICSSLKRLQLNHAEIVERRRLLSTSFSRSIDSGKAGSQAASTGGKSVKGSKKGGKPDLGAKGGSKDGSGKISRKSTLLPEAPKSSKAKRLGNSKESKQLKQDSDDPDISSASHPLLDPKIEFLNGKVYITGCLSLICLNLSRNRIGDEGLHELLSAVQYQAVIGRRKKGYLTMPGLIALYLQKNEFSDNNPYYIKLEEILSHRDPLTTLQLPAESLVPSYSSHADHS